MSLGLRVRQVGYDLRTLRGDVFGGITAAVVGLPVALAFGVASGLGPLAGIYGAVAVGFFAAVFGGTRSQISGPTGPMSVAMAAIVTVHSDNLADAFFIVILAGLLQVLLGALRIGRLVAFTPHSVISGFMSGIGLIIIVLQALPFLGAGSADGGPLGAVRAIPDAVAGVNYDAFAIAVVTLAVGVLFPARIGRWFPPTLAALLAGTLLGVLWLDGAPVIGEVPTGMPDLVLPSVDAGLLLNAVVPALTLALLGSIDSLLTSLIVDAKSRAIHNPDKELVGQGIANTAAGLIGALPGAGNTLSTLVNFQAGGRTAVAGVLVAVILVAMAVGLGDFVESVPHAALAGILVKVGWDIMDRRFLARAHQVQRENLVVMLGTMALTVALDLITAVMVGLIAAGIASTRQFVRLEMDSVVSTPLLDRAFLGRVGPDGDEFSARVGMVSLRGTFTVASSRRLVNTISADIRDHEVLIMDFTETVYMDDSAAMVVEQLIEQENEEMTPCIIMGLQGPVADNLHALSVLDHVPADHYVSTLDEARELALRILYGGDGSGG